ncbi:MAG: acetate kinase [Terriglobales bacterium]
MRVLCINTGSSSLKWALFAGGERVGAAQATELRQPEDFRAALAGALRGLSEPPEAVAHRIVAANTVWPGARRLDAGLETELTELIPLAPDHLPQALAALAAARAAFPSLPQVACSDSSFHRTLPAVARRLPLAAELGLERYGYHGLSCASVVAALRAERALPERLIIAHLGHGCSLTGVRSGASVETTMGFSPLGGVMMSTRSGDLDPGVLLYLLRERGLTPEALSRMLNQEAGLRGVSGSSGDMKTLLADARPEAAAAIELFVYTVRQAVGALAAALGGVELLVFTGGIGEHSEEIRRRVCAGLEWLVPAARVIPAGEERVMAAQAEEVLHGVSLR